MTARSPTSDLAHRVAEGIHAPAPWEVIGERSTRYEVHLQGSSVELVRGPVTVEGYGVRLFRPRGEALGTGFLASTDLSPKGIAGAVEAAEQTAHLTEFPAKSVELPTGKGAAPEVPIVDLKLWKDPARAVGEYAEVLLRAFDGRRGIVPSFGSVKATLGEVSLANSAGLRVAYPSTHIDLELAVKAFGGPEGRPPGEYWVTETSRRLEPENTSRSVDAWCRYAADVRRAGNPPSGEQAVILPTDVLSGIIPPVLGFRCTGAARLRQLAPEVGSTLAAASVTIHDEGDYPWSTGSGPYDDEGTPRARRPLIERGAVKGLLYDALYASAFGTRSTGNGIRGDAGPNALLRFAHAPVPGPSTLVVAPGDGGTVDELAEAAGEGVLVTQFGWARPDSISGAFGGEIRIGYRIRGGKLAEPVRGGTVGGTVLSTPGQRSLLADVGAVGSQASLADGFVSPPLLVRNLTVAGA